MFETYSDIFKAYSAKFKYINNPGNIKENSALDIL